MFTVAGLFFFACVSMVLIFGTDGCCEIIEVVMTGNIILW